MYRSKYKKALTFSFDDGTVFDKHLVELLNKYGMKCTFNLNSGKMTHADNWVNKNVIISHLNRTEIKDMYKGHEIASHSLTHPFFDRLDYETQLNEIKTDIENLEYYFNTKIKGFALPYGCYNDDTLKALKECNIHYNRLAGTTMSFDKPKDLMKFSGTCHFHNQKIMELAKQFIELNPDEEKIFYIWGHSYELEVDNLWDEFEKLLKYLANRDDIYYCTNSEAFHID